VHPSSSSSTRGNDSRLKNKRVEAVTIFSKIFCAAKRVRLHSNGNHIIFGTKQFALKRAMTMQTLVELDAFKKPPFEKPLNFLQFLFQMQMFLAVIFVLFDIPD
jgi:hypothetical protein